MRPIADQEPNNKPEDRRVGGLRLRPYQTNAFNEIAGALNDGDRVVYQLPTGGGKTVIFCALIEPVVRAGLRVLVLVHRDEIMQQVAEALRDLGIPHGIVAPGYPVTEDLVQVASVMSLVRRLEWLRRNQPQFIVIDETHHVAARTWTRIVRAVEDANILGVTATPRRLDGKPLDDFFDRLIVGPSIAKLIDGGHLSPVTVFTPPRSPDLTRVRIRAGDYAVDELSAVMSKGIIVDTAVTEYERLCAGVPTIAFCVDIAHSKLVAAAFRRAGYRAEHVDGETPQRERRALIAALDNGEVDILSNCGLISEGLDVPGVEAAILLRPTRSLALYLQMIGRALRPGKDLAYILDHAGNVYRHGLPTARRRWNLRGKQRPDGAAEGLIRCPECGAMNAPDAEVCEHCGAQLVVRLNEQWDRIVVPGRTLAEVTEEPVTDAELANMTLRDVLRWSADADDVIRREHAIRIADARNYQPSWVNMVAGRPWEAVYEDAMQWRKRQQARGR
jgi:superfamily II DNA or RNA helicase